MKVKGQNQEGIEAALSAECVANVHHVEAYQKQFGTSALTLMADANAQLPTDQRLDKFAGSKDMAMVALMYNYGRYLLIFSSQPGGQAANLQSVWNDNKNAPWDSKYTININTEMNY